MTAGLISDRSEVEALLSEVADELEQRNATAEVVMVGGSWLLWHAHRAATRDVDSASRIGKDLGEVVARVGARHDLDARWLNDAAAAFWPAGASFEDCQVVYQHSALVVRAPPPEVIFVMKMYRADPQDREDLVTLWNLCDFSEPEAAVSAFESGYPHAPEDPHLVSYIAQIAEDAAVG